MDKNEKIWSLIIRYLDDNLSPEDAEEFEKWLDEKSENRWTLNMVNQIWKASDSKTEDALIQNLNLEKDWERIEKKMDRPSREERKQKIERFKKARKKKKVFSTFLKVAALVLVAATSVLITLQYAPIDDEPVYEQAFNEITTSSAERATVTLGDGSRVTLNAESKIIAPKHFDRNERVVEVEGQAYFEIKSDRSRPFYVRTEHTIVEVVGTSFDVRSYENERNVQVVVRNGTVEMRKSADDESLVLNAGYLGTYDRETAHLNISHVDDLENYFGWLDGRLTFIDKPIKEVLSDIERRYDITINTELAEGALEGQKLTADLKTRAIEDVMDVLQMSLGINYEIDGDHVLIKPKP